LTRHSDINVSTSDMAGRYTSCCCISDMAVFPGDLLLLADRDNQSVKLVDPTSDQLLDKLQLPGKPHGLCLLPGNRAAVTIPAKSTIQTISVTNNKLALHDVITIEEKCVGINCVHDYFVVGFHKPGKVALIQTTGKISETSQNKTLFKYPDYICVTTENTRKVIYVSDNGTMTITRLSEELQVLQSFTDPALQSPHGLASVGGGQLLVVNYDILSTLSVLDVTTGQVTRLLREDENLRCTRCAAVSHTLGTVYVNDWCDLIAQYRFR